MIGAVLSPQLQFKDCKLAKVGIPIFHAVKITAISRNFSAQGKMLQISLFRPLINYRLALKNQRIAW